MNFKLISDPDVLKILIQENGDSLVDVHDFPELIVDDRKRKNKDSKSVSRLRKSVVEKLIAAQSSLPQGIKLLVIEGHRPLTVQKEYFDGYSKELSSLHPDWDAKKIYDEASKYVAPPDIIPPHSTGGAVDLTLVGADGKELDMGTLVNADPEESHNACFTAAENVSETGKTNRAILINAMTKAGFINYPTEWWHWSYGDRYWAYTLGKPTALFGAAE